VKFTPTPLPGAFLVEIEPQQDERGHFARAFCAEEFTAHGLNPTVAQTNVSYNRRKGTLRGLHYQAAPHAEAKLVRCTAGSVFDVIVDLRPRSPAYRRWFAVELAAATRAMLYVPEGCAHGFQTLQDDCEMHYQMSAPYQPAAQRGVRWNEPALAIPWPINPPILGAKDAGLPGLEQADR
jgi:dTDP-4-dehydrorhamnose 3,5-epimerase